MMGCNQNAGAWAGGMAEIVERLLSKCKALSSNPSPAKKKKKKIYIYIYIYIYLCRCTQLRRQRSRGSWFKASPSKKLARLPSQQISQAWCRVPVISAAQEASRRIVV
jgi:hypothetical protein